MASSTTSCMKFFSWAPMGTIQALRQQVTYSYITLICFHSYVHTGAIQPSQQQSLPDIHSTATCLQWHILHVSIHAETQSTILTKLISRLRKQTACEQQAARDLECWICILCKKSIELFAIVLQITYTLALDRDLSYSYQLTHYKTHCWTGLFARIRVADMRRLLPPCPTLPHTLVSILLQPRGPVCLHQQHCSHWVAPDEENSRLWEGIQTDT